MLSLYKPLQAAQAETYFKEHYSQDDYYSEGQTCMGRWLGKGAAALGLAGEVKREDFTALLQGRNPHDGDVLVDVATHNGKHNAGWDAGLSAPKTVSIQALLEDKRLMEAHNEAVEATVPQLERFALANKRPIITANIVAAAFNHQAARPTPGALPDPQLHTHVVLMNMTQRPDSKWRALREREIFKAREFLTAVYRTELAKRVQKLGYRTRSPVLTEHGKSPAIAAIRWKRSRTAASKSNKRWMRPGFRALRLNKSSLSKHAKPRAAMTKASLPPGGSARPRVRHRHCNACRQCPQAGQCL
jgi:conjugative relaxase-like TrwC/TraI family protein